MDMERSEPSLHQLRAFVVLAEELHFGRAAARLGIAQPPLSQQIRRLEQKVGAPLLRRGSGGIELTASGQELLPAARRTLTCLADGVDAARAVADGRRGLLRLGFSASLALTVLPGLLCTFRERAPGARLEIREMTTGPQLAALSDKTIDVGLLREPPAGHGDLIFQTVMSEPFVAVLPHDHPLAVERTVPVATLAGSPFVLLPREHGQQLYDQIDGLCRAAGFTPQVVQHAVEWQTVCALVKAGLGVSLAPASIRRIRLKGIAFRRIQPCAPRTRVAAAWRRNDPNPLTGTLLAALGQDPPEAMKSRTPTS